MKISTLKERKIYYDWWQEQIAEQDSLLEGIPRSSLPELDLERYQAMHQFGGHVLKILATVADTLQPRTWDEFLRYGLTDPSEDGSTSA